MPKLDWGYLVTINSYSHSAWQLNIKSSFVCDISNFGNKATQEIADARPSLIDSRKNSSEIRNTTGPIKVLLLFLDFAYN